MSIPARILAAPLTHTASGVFMALLFALFAYAHMVKFADSGRVALLVFVVAECVVATLFLLRTQPKSFAHSPLDWVVAALGTFIPMLLRPASTTLFDGADWGVAAGSVLQILGILSLNRSFAIVPALREVKTGGMYRWVRHPIYASYLITLSAYLAGNFSLRNGVVWLLSIACLVARVHLEERHLAQAPAYRAYMNRVRWRLIPRLY